MEEEYSSNDENEVLNAELSDIDRELTVMDETIRELHETNLSKPEPKAPFGYYIKKNKLKIHKEEAKKIKLIYSLFYKHKRSLEEISEEVQLAVSKIKEILINPLYFGKILLNGEIRNGRHPSIIDKHFCKICNIDVEEITQKYLSNNK